MIATLADRKLKAQYQREGLALNAMEQAPLEQVRRLKLDAARHLMAQMGSSVVRSHAFRHFVRENSLWLKPSGTLKLTDTMLYLSYFAGILAVLAIIFGEIRIALNNKKYYG